MIPAIQSAIADRIVDDEERQDILWLCSQVDAKGKYFCAVKSDMQRLHGVMHGMAIDGEISKEEVLALQGWLGAHDHLRTCWPYDELDSLLVSVLCDGVIDQREHFELLHFFSEFGSHAGHRSMDPPVNLENVSVRGVCAVCPEIEFIDRQFCFTGSSERSSRSEMQDRVTDRGGRASKNVVKALDYLVVGADGNLVGPMRATVAK